MPKYSVEFKHKVLASCDEIGPNATFKKYGIAEETLYKWRRKREMVGLMRKKNKSYTQEEKIEILNYFWDHGYAETEKKFDINSGTVNKWERLFKEHGLEGLVYDVRGRKPYSLSEKINVNEDKDLLEEVQRLRMENLYLKKLDALVQQREKQQLKKKLK